jgi:hypothetical protein
MKVIFFRFPTISASFGHHYLNFTCTSQSRRATSAVDNADVDNALATVTGGRVRFRSSHVVRTLEHHERMFYLLFGLPLRFLLAFVGSGACDGRAVEA